MRKLFFPLLMASLVFAACKKSNSSGASSSTFTASVNGKATTFNIFQATLLRNTSSNQKRMDIAGTSTDNKQRLIFTLGMETAAGNGMKVKSYVLNAFPEDDPNTPEDESLTTQGFTTLSTPLGNNNWLTDVYSESGLFNLTSCDSAHYTVSGTFQTTLRDYDTDTVVYSITNGKMTNVKYMVVN